MAKISVAIVPTIAEGQKCLSPAKYCDGVRCSRVLSCDNKTCKAVFAEIDYLTEKIDNLIADQKAFYAEMGWEYPVK